MTGDSGWAWSDGWILMAVYLAGRDRGAALHEVVAAADATNHAIPTAREMSRALTKLIGCGVVGEDDGRYLIHSRHLPGVEEAQGGRGGLFASGDKGLRWLRAAGLAARGSGRVELTEADMRAAYEQYRKSLGSR